MPHPENNFWRRSMRLLRDQSGIAIILAIFAMVLAVAIATEITYETQVEYIASAQTVNHLKAYYAAKSGVEISLFRILLFKKVLAQFGAQLKDNKDILDVIWSFPFSWPPVPPDSANTTQKDEAKKIIKESTMDAQFLATIESEGSKIDINDLGAGIKPLADAIHAQLKQIFDNEREHNKVFKKKYDNYDFDKLINNIQDWIDEDKSSLNGGDESSKYDQPQGLKNYQLPPNAAFKTIEELHMVADMEDEFYDLLKDKITVYGTQGINVNYASEKVLRALDPLIKDEILAAIIKRRGTPAEGGLFKDTSDFFNFLEGKGMRTDALKKANLPLLFDAEHNFRIVSSGTFANVRTQITAVTFDIEGLTTAYSKRLDDLDKANNPTDPNQPPAQNPPGTPPGTPPPAAPPKAAAPLMPRGRPTVVFWQEN